MVELTTALNLGGLMGHLICKRCKRRVGGKNLILNMENQPVHGPQTVCGQRETERRKAESIKRDQVAKETDAAHLARVAEMVNKSSLLGTMAQAFVSARLVPDLTIN